MLWYNLPGPRIIGEFYNAHLHLISLLVPIKEEDGSMIIVYSKPVLYNKELLKIEIVFIHHRVLFFLNIL